MAFCGDMRKLNPSIKTKNFLKFSVEFILNKMSEIQGNVSSLVSRWQEAIRNWAEILYRSLIFRKSKEGDHDGKNAQQICHFLSGE